MKIISGIVARDNKQIESQENKSDDAPMLDAVKCAMTLQEFLVKQKPSKENELFLKKKKKKSLVECMLLTKDLIFSRQNRKKRGKKKH